MPEERRHPRLAIALCFTSAALGGLVGWTLFYLGLQLWGLAIGAVVVVSLATAGGHIDPDQRRSESVVISLACSLLTWPPMWLAGVFVYYWITGNSLGFH